MSANDAVRDETVSDAIRELDDAAPNTKGAARRTVVNLAAARDGVPVTTVNRHLDELERQGEIYAPADGRVCLTDAGNADDTPNPPTIHDGAVPVEESGEDDEGQDTNLTPGGEQADAYARGEVDANEPESGAEATASGLGLAAVRTRFQQMNADGTRTGLHRNELENKLGEETVAVAIKKGVLYEVGHRVKLTPKDELVEAGE